MEMKLYHGSPENREGRSERELRTYAFLDGLKLDYERTDHPDTPASSMEVCEKIDAVLEVRICKNLFLCNRQETEFYLLVMPGDKPFHTRELSKQIGSSRLSFARQEYLGRFLGLQAGSVSVLGLINDTDHRVHLLVDEDVQGEEMFGCHPCVNTSSLRFRTSDLFEKILPALSVQPIFVKLSAE